MPIKHLLRTHLNLPQPNSSSCNLSQLKSSKPNLIQCNPTQLNSTQPNTTQLNSTQLKATQPKQTKQTKPNETQPKLNINKDLHRYPTLGQINCKITHYSLIALKKATNQLTKAKKFNILSF